MGKKVVGKQPVRKRPVKKPTVSKPELPRPTLIGWREYIDLPDWGIRQVLAKVDTGARSSAIDVSHIEKIDGDRVRFEAISDRAGELTRHFIEAPIARRGRVRSSFGTLQERVFVEVRVRLGGRTIGTEVGLVDRENMICRMLLGRKTLENTWRVDPGHCYLHGKRRRPRKRRAEA